MVDKRMSAEQRKEAIAEAAMPLFALKGFKGTTTREIADAAGVSEALMYRHFPSKEALYGAIQFSCCQMATEQVDSLTKLKPSTSSLVVAIYFMIRSIALGVGGFEEVHGTLKRMMMQSLIEDGEFARSFLQARFKEWLPNMNKLFAAAEKSGDLIVNSKFGANKMWFCHHISVILGMMFIHEKSVVEYEGSQQDIVEEALIFSLRGLGLKEEAIEKYFKPESFDLMFKDFSK